MQPVLAKCSTAGITVTESQDSRVMLEGTTGGLVQPPCFNLSPSGMLLRIVSRQLWNISSEGDYKTSLSNLFQCSVTCTLKFFLIVR